MSVAYFEILKDFNYLTVFKLQHPPRIKSMRSCTPDFPGTFSVRSSSIRFEFDFRDEVRVL